MLFLCYAFKWLSTHEAACIQAAQGHLATRNCPSNSFKPKASNTAVVRRGHCRVELQRANAYIGSNEMLEMFPGGAA